MSEILDDISSMKKIYEDEDVVSVLAPNPCAVGHLLLMPKKKYTILEQVPDYVVSRLFDVANKLASSVFEALGATGTNIMIQNGLAAGQTTNQVLIHIIPRRDNDGLNFQWTPKSLSEEEMSTIELQYKDETASVGEFETKESKPVELKNTKTIKEDKENYMLKQLDRLP